MTDSSKSPGDSSAREIDLVDIFGFLWRIRVFLFCGLIFGSVAATMVLFTMTGSASYTSRITFVPEIDWKDPGARYRSEKLDFTSLPDKPGFMKGFYTAMLEASPALAAACKDYDWSLTDFRSAKAVRLTGSERGLRVALILPFALDQAEVERAMVAGMEGGAAGINRRDLGEREKQIAQALETIMNKENEELSTLESRVQESLAVISSRSMLLKRYRSLNKNSILADNDVMTRGLVEADIKVALNKIVVRLSRGVTVPRSMGNLKDLSLQSIVDRALQLVAMHLDAGQMPESKLRRVSEQIAVIQALAQNLMVKLDPAIRIVPYTVDEKAALARIMAIKGREIRLKSKRQRENMLAVATLPLIPALIATPDKAADSFNIRAVNSPRLILKLGFWGVIGPVLGLLLGATFFFFRDNWAGIKKQAGRSGLHDPPRISQIR